MSADMNVIRETTLLTDGDETSTLTPPPGNVDPGDVLYHKLIITNGGTTDATEVTIEDTFSGETMIAGTLNVSPIAFNDSFSAVGNTVLRVGTANTINGGESTFVNGNLLSNDRGSGTIGTGTISGDNISGFQIDAVVSGTSVKGGTYNIFADGTFNYVNDGTDVLVSGKIPTDTFTYTIRDAGLDNTYNTADDLLSTATVTITFAEQTPGGNSHRVWYVDSAAAPGGDGTSAKPFQNMSAIANNGADIDSTGEYIYVQDGALPVTGPIALENGQQLIGEGAALSVAGFTIATAGTNSVLNAPSGFIVTLGQNNTIAGITIGNDSGTSGGITGTSFGTLTVNNAAINVEAQGLSLTTGAVGGTGFTSTDSDSGLQNVLLSSVTGTVNLGSGTLSGATGISSTEGNLVVIGGSANINYSGTISSAVFDVAAMNIRSGHTGTITLDGNVTATNGLGLLFADADGTYNLNGVVSLTGNGNAGIDIVSGSNGTFTFGTAANLGTITNNVGQDAFVVSASNANVTYNGTITDNNSNAVNIDNHDSGTITFQNGSINSTGGGGIDVTNSNGGTVNFNSQVTVSTGGLTGINLTGNTGSAINFNATGNGLDITTTTGIGFNATGGGTIRVTASGTADAAGGNTITSVGGTALNVNATTIGTGGLIFQKISANGGSVDGIILDNTGTTAGLTITGTGSANSGGIIQNLTGQNNDGISLNNTSNFSASWLRIDNVGGHGINATNLGGSNSVANSSIADWNSDQTASATKDGIHLVNTNTNTTMIVTNTTFDGSEVNSATVNGNDGVFMESQGTGAMNLRVEDSIFTHMYGDGVQVSSTGGATGTVNVRIIDNDFTNSVPYSGGPGVGGGNGGISIQPFGGNVGGAAQQFTVLVQDNVLDDIMKPITNVGAIGGTSGRNVNADITIQNNTISDLLGGRGITFTVDGGDADIKIVGNSVNFMGDNSKHAINVNFTENNTPGFGTHGSGDVQIVNNNVGNLGQLWSTVDVSGAEAVMVQTQGTSTMTALMSGNNVTANTPFEVMRAKAGGTSVMNVTITGNTLNDTDTASRRELDVTAGYVSGQGGTINASVTGNTIAAGGIIQLRELNSGTLNVTQASAAAVSAANGGATTNPTGAVTYGAAAPPLPNDPALPPNFLFADAIPLADEPVADTPAPDTSGGDTSGGGAPSGGDIPMPHAPTGPVVVDDMVLSQAELDLIVDAAIARWAAAGATDAQVAAMRATLVTVDNLGGLMLGQSGLGTITLDDNAGGWNWFVDSTPGDDSEYAGSGTRLGAVDAYGAAGTRMDLLTVVTHELGHQIGLEDSYAAADRSGLMYGTIAAGERRLAGGEDVASAGEGPVTGAFAFAPIALGTIPGGRTVTVEWRAVVDGLAPANEDRLVSPVLGQGILKYKDASDPIDPTGFKTALSNAQSFNLDSLTLGNLVYTDVNKDGDYDAGTDALMSGVTLKLYADSNNSGYYESGTDLAIVFFDANGNGTYQQGIDEARPAGTTGANIVQLSATTNASGVYSFASLAPGDYIVVVDSANFGAGVLGSRRAHPGAPDPNLNQDGFNKAEQFLPGDPGTYAATRAIRLDYGLEPTAGPVGPANDTNNTLDLGFDLPNQPPAIGALNGDNVTYTEDGPAVVLDLGGNATVDDPENGDFDTGTLTVQITGNRVDAEDILRVKDGGNVTVDFLNSKILYSGVEMASFTGGESGAPLVITFNATASESRVQEVLRLVTYENGDTVSPNTATRTVTFTLVDGDGVANGGNETSSVTTTINIVAVNDPPQGDDHLDVAINEDATYVFKYIPVGNPGAVNDFNFNDDDGNIFAGVRVVDLPLLGKLKVNGVDVVANQVVSATDIQNGLFTYTPAAEGSGNDYASFTFQVIDDGSNTAPNDNEANFASTFSFDVAALNDAPQSTGFDNVSFTEGAFYVQLDTGFDQVLTDVDSADFDGGSLTARVSVNEVASEDVIDFLTGGTSLLSISGNTLSYNNVAFATFTRGVGQDLTFNFNSNASLQAVQTIMRNLVYVNANQSQPSTATRTVEYILTDGDGGTLTLNSTVAVSTINDAPVLNGLGETLFDNLPANSAVRYSISSNQLGDDFILGQASTVRSFTVQLSDGVANNDGLFNNFSGTISWAVYADGGDRPGALIASGTDAAPVVSDTGAQTPTNADIFFVNIDLGQNLALAAGSYWIALHENAWGSASDGTSISWVSGSNGSGDSVAYGLDLAAPPAGWGVDIYRDMTLRVNGPTAAVTFGENLVNATPQVIDGDVAYSDPEGNLASGTVTVSGLLAEDRVAIRHQGTDPGQIGVSGNNVTYSGTTIGSFSGGTGNNFVVTLNGSATNAAVDALIQNLTYGNVSDTPTATRTLTVTVADGSGASNADSITINVTGEGDNPVLDLDGAGGADTAVGYAYEQDPTGTGSFAVAATVTDIDSTDFDTGTLTVGFTANAQAGDVIELPAFSGDPTHEVAIDGAQVKYNNVVIGTYAAGDHDTALTVTFNASATAEAVQWVVRGIRVLHTGDAPSTAPRTLNYALTDGDGGSTSANATINIQPDNDAPASTGPIYSLIGFNENSPVPQPLMDGVVLSDPDLPASFAGGSLNLNVSGGEGGINLKAGSLFSIVSDGGGGFDLVYDNAGTPVIIGKIAGFGTANMTVSAFTSEATLARLNDLVDDFGYIIVGDNPTPGDKTVTMTFNDGNNVGNGSTVAKTTIETQTLQVNASNDLPTITNLAGDAPTFTEGGPPVWLDVGDNAVVADLDNADFGGHDLTVAITAGYHFGDRITTGPDVTLSNLYNPGSTVTVDGAVIGTIQSTAAGTLGIALNSNATLARVQILVRDFTFQTPSQDPTSDTRSIQLTIDNHSGNAVTVNSSVNVVATDDAPVANPDSTSTAESASVNIAVLANDTELDGPPLAVAEINGTAVNPGDTVNLGNGATAKLELGGSITYNPNGAFNWLTEAGSGAVNTSAVQIFTYKLVGGTATTNVSVTINGQVSSDDILYGDATDNVITGTPQRDIFYVQQGGNDTVHGLATGDTFYFGAAFTAGDTVNGGDGADAIILQGNYPALTFGTGVTSNISSVESISLAPGDITFYGDTANNFYDYNLTMLNSNVAAGGLLKVNGFYLRAGEDLTFNGAAETDGSFIILAGQGVDTLTGGGQGDVFIFGHDGRFGNSDVVNGGGGYDSLYLRGDYALDFTSGGFTGTISGIESITLASASDLTFIGGGDGEFDYSIVWKDSMLATGSTVTVNGGGLGTAETMAFNGAGEVGGHFRLWGGAAADTLTGGGGNDLIYGGRGADQLKGNGGADTFRYQATNESPIGLANIDTILDFTHGVDKIDLSVIDAKVDAAGDQAFTFIGAATFTAAGPISAGELRAHQIDVLTNLWQVEGDTDGNGVADFVLQAYVDPLQSLTIGDFVL